MTEDQYGQPVPTHMRALHRALMHGERVSIEEEYYYVVGENRFPVWVTASPIMVGGKITGAISVSRNISKEKELDMMKSDLVFLASHQLRTPASAVKSTLSLLIDGYLGKLEPKQMDDLRAAYAQNNFELKLINDILDVARLDSHKTELAPERVSIACLVRDVINEELSAAADRKQELTVKAPAKLMVTADPTKLREIIENLVTNAIKYTPDGGRIHALVKSVGEDAVIVISDNGIGVPKDEIKNLFLRFSRASNATKISMPGTGLGLYLAKSLVEMHHGRIEVESELGKGTEFTVTIPKKYKETKNND